MNLVFAVQGAVLGLLIFAISKRHREVSGSVLGITILIIAVALGIAHHQGVEVSAAAFGWLLVIVGIVFLIAGATETSTMSNVYMGMVGGLVLLIIGALYLAWVYFPDFFLVILGILGVFMLCVVLIFEYLKNRTIIDEGQGAFIDPTEPKLGMSDIGGLEKVKEEVHNFIIGPLKNPEMAIKYGKNLSGGILLYGPPGTGKTLIAEAIASECGASMYIVNVSDVLSKWFGESEKNLKKIMADAKVNAPSIVIIDEVDGLGKQRQTLEVDPSRNFMSQLLKEMDNITGHSMVYIVGTTNMPWDVDMAMLRPGRFDKKVLVPPPGPVARKKIFEIHLRTPAAEGLLADNVDIDLMAKATEGYSGADIREICEMAIEAALSDAEKEGEMTKVQARHFERSLKRKRSSIKTWVNRVKALDVSKGAYEFSDELGDFLDAYDPETVGGYL